MWCGKISLIFLAMYGRAWEWSLPHSQTPQTWKWEWHMGGYTHTSTSVLWRLQISEEWNWLYLAPAVSGVLMPLARLDTVSIFHNLHHPPAPRIVCSQTLLAVSILHSRLHPPSTVHWHCHDTPCHCSCHSFENEKQLTSCHNHSLSLPPWNAIMFTINCFAQEWTIGTRPLSPPPTRMRAIPYLSKLIDLSLLEQVAVVQSTDNLWPLVVLVTTWSTWLGVACAMRAADVNLPLCNNSTWTHITQYYTVAGGVLNVPSTPQILAKPLIRMHTMPFKDTNDTHTLPLPPTHTPTHSWKTESFDCVTVFIHCVHFRGELQEAVAIVV